MSFNLISLRHLATEGPKTNQGAQVWWGDADMADQQTCTCRIPIFWYLFSCVQKLRQGWETSEMERNIRQRTVACTTSSSTLFWPRRQSEEFERMDKICCRRKGKTDQIRQDMFWYIAYSQCCPGEACRLLENYNIYTFLVDRRANKFWPHLTAKSSFLHITV